MKSWPTHSAAACGLLLILGVLAGSSEMVTADEAASDDLEFPLLPCSDALIVKGGCAGEDVLLLLDTGLTGSILDVSLMPNLGAPVGQVRVHTPAGVETLKLFLPPDLTLGPLNIATQDPVACTDLEMFRRASGHDVRGLLGMSFLKEYVLSIRPEQMTFTLTRSLPEEPFELGSPIRISTSMRGVPSASARVGRDDTCHFTIDSGMSAFGALGTPLYDRLSGSGVITRVGSAEAVVVSGSVHFDFGVLDSLSIGPHTIRGPEFSRSETSGLGLDFLLRFDATLDFSGEQLYLREIAASKGPLPRTDHRIGIEASEQGPQVRFWRGEVSQGPSMPQAGDMIRSVNGLDVSTLSLACVREILARRPSLPNTLRVVRDEESLDVVVPPMQFRETRTTE